jgi:hypothetical protein
MPILYSDEEASLEPHRYVPQMTRLVMYVKTVRCRIGIGGALCTRFLDPEVLEGRMLLPNLSLSLRHLHFPRSRILTAFTYNAVARRNGFAAHMIALGYIMTLGH